MKCPKCGSDINRTQNFCSSCGFNIKNTASNTSVLSASSQQEAEEGASQTEPVVNDRVSGGHTSSVQETKNSGSKDIKNVHIPVTDASSLQTAISEIFGETTSPSTVDGNTTMPSIETLKSNLSYHLSYDNEVEVEEKNKKNAVIRLVFTCIFVIFTINNLYDVPRANYSTTLYWLGFLFTILAFLISLYSLVNTQKKQYSFIALALSALALIFSLFTLNGADTANINRENGSPDDHVLETVYEEVSRR